jgi:hypothetical protein
MCKPRRNTNTVELTVKNPGARLKPGMPVDVEFEK